MLRRELFPIQEHRRRIGIHHLIAVQTCIACLDDHILATLDSFPCRHAMCINRMANHVNAALRVELIQAAAQNRFIDFSKCHRLGSIAQHDKYCFNDRPLFGFFGFILYHQRIPKERNILRHGSTELMVTVIIDLHKVRPGHQNRYHLVGSISIHSHQSYV